jgi:hypothetical protein
LIIRSVDRFKNPQKNLISYEKEALNFLRKQPEGGIFALPVFNNLSYIPAYSKKPVYFADKSVLSNLGVNYGKRADELKNLKEINFKTLPVKYFYLLKNDKNFDKALDKIRKELDYQIIFENTNVMIIKKIK